MIDFWFMTQEPNYVENNWFYLTAENPSKEEIKNIVCLECHKK